MDIWIAINDENATKMVKALNEFGFNPPELQKELFLKKEKGVVKPHWMHQGQMFKYLSAAQNRGYLCDISRADPSFNSTD